MGIQYHELICTHLGARIFNQCAHLIADSPLAIRRALHTLAVREAQRFRRTELIDRLQKLLTVETSGNTNDD
jgi:hypothetical protein